MSENTALTVRLPSEMAEAVRTYAFVTGLSTNEVIKRSVAEHLAEHAHTDQVRTAFDKVLADHKVTLDKLKDL